jgi:DNA modification methylase
VQIKHGDFRDKCKEIADNSIPLLLTDPPYDEASLPLYKDLGKEAIRILVNGGSLVTYVGEGYQDIAIEYLKESGLKFWNIIVVKLAGNHSDIHHRKTFQYCKTLLWFVKGDRLREGIPISYIPNYVESTTPDKLLHSKVWEQSTTEAEFIIKYLTLPNETILDCMCGAGTTGIAALKLGRQFIGIDIDKNECKNADINIRRYCERSSST